MGDPGLGTSTARGYPGGSPGGPPADPPGGPPGDTPGDTPGDPHGASPGDTPWDTPGRGMGDCLVLCVGAKDARVTPGHPGGDPRVNPRVMIWIDFS